MVSNSLKLGRRKLDQPRLTQDQVKGKYTAFSIPHYISIPSIFKNIICVPLNCNGFQVLEVRVVALQAPLRAQRGHHIPSGILVSLIDIALVENSMSMAYDLSGSWSSKRPGVRIVRCLRLEGKTRVKQSIPACISNRTI